MAIKTITLRPTKGVCSTTVYPTTIDTTCDVHLLVSEEEADDDSTYATLTTAALPTTSPHFAFSVPEEYAEMTPKELRLYLRCRATSSTTSLDITVPTLPDESGEGGSLVKPVIGTMTGFSTNYSTQMVIVPDEYIMQVWSVLNKLKLEQSEYAEYLFIFSATNSKNNSIYLTQFYIEADFDIEESSGVYVRKNGSFVEASQMYQKVNGAWTEITAEECKSLIQSHS